MELETFKITVLPLREKLINISWRMMEDRSDAEDIVQETFLKLWQIREKLDGYNSVSRRWLYKWSRTWRWTN